MDKNIEPMVSYLDSEYNIDIVFKLKVLFNMNKLTKEEELDLLKDRCITILDFVMSKNNISQAIPQVKDIVIETYNKKNLSGFKNYIIKDITKWASGLPKNDLHDLNVILNSKFGITIKEMKDYN